MTQDEQLDIDDIQQVLMQEMIVNKIKGEPSPFTRFLIARRRVLITELREVETLLIEFERLAEPSLVSPRKR